MNPEAQKTIERDLNSQIRNKWLKAVHAMDPIIQKNIGWPGTLNVCACQVHGSEFWVQVIRDNDGEKVAEVAVAYAYLSDEDIDPAIRLIFELPQIGKQVTVEDFNILFPTAHVTNEDAANRVVRGLVRFCELVYWDLRAQDKRLAYLETNVPDYEALFPAMVS